ncbi:MAG: DegT/DnrJ/EryC1/StrS family aminotransferase [Paludibacteraceae bacterium]|nr:DegT/DnrJ/EryC1/StrS family aminotransferase [Paludibacteraceae bacterium]
MIPRLDISFSLKNQWAFCFGQAYAPAKGEYLLNHARSGIVMALRTALPEGGRVGVVTYNCHTVANAVVESGCTPIFVDVTEDMHVDVQHLSVLEIDAIVVTNLFGIRNDIDAICTVVGQKPIIVDNAHGYGLPAEGDFTVYSINQGKMPALGAGGLLWVNSNQYQASIQQQYAALPSYTQSQELKLFITMLAKAWMHIPWIYGLITRRMKNHRGKAICREAVALRRMPKGVSRMYQQALPTIAEQIQQQRANAQQMADALISKGLAEKVWYGDNAFMLIARTKDTIGLSKYLADRGVESATHFARAIEWAKEFGYTEGQCPMAERLTKELIMIPTYVPLAQV